MENYSNILNAVREICERKAAAHMEPSVATVIEIATMAHDIDRQTLNDMIGVAVSNGSLKRYRTLNGDALYPADMSITHASPVSFTRKAIIR